MDDSRTFKMGEIVMLYDGTNKRNSIELAEVGKDCWYESDVVLITSGAFNVEVNKSSVHKLPPTLKKALKPPTGSQEDVKHD